MDRIVIIDFGSQTAQLIARRVREAEVFCELVPPNEPIPERPGSDLRGIILSGGPASVYEAGSPRADPALFSLGVPVLGICYGMQWGCHVLGGRVRPAPRREFGRTPLTVRRTDPLFDGVPRRSVAWMSHGDRVEGGLAHLKILASSDNCPHAAVRHKRVPFYGVQFHPEVVHTEHGRRILENFVLRICRARPGWKPAAFIRRSVEEIRAGVGDDGVVCALSGGVDSAVTALLVHRAVGRRLTCVFVDNGLLRLEEAREVREAFARRLRLKVVDATEQFLGRLRGVTDPERKRKIIGHEFIAVFKEAARRIPRARWLAQGTLYPDVIESRSAFGGPSVTIKTHHNVGGLPRSLGFKLIEPLRLLFKDEVRRIGRALRLPESLLARQPFPGPGLAVRALGPVDRPRLDRLRRADAIVRAEVERAGLAPELWQYFAVLLPVKTVGVMGDARTHEEVVAVRAVKSQDAMTADWARLPGDLLARISSRIINEVRGVNRVVYDVSSKPPSTIEWE
jgi:GMP synthase (glutamine-hydrolysing)